MIMDEYTEFADAASVAAAAGTALIGDVIDLGAVPRDIGVEGGRLFLVITVDTEIVTAAGAGTIKFQLASDAQAAIATDGSATIHLDTGTFVTNVAASNDPKLNAGSLVFASALPMEGKPYERYLGILATIATTAVSAGKINAFLTPDVAKWRAYPKAVS